MKSFVHIASLVLALGAAGLLAGCNSHPKTATEPPRPAHDFDVVETSTKRLLSPKDMEIVRAKVADYLEQRGLTASGDYYVKVFLEPDHDGVPADWVIVRFTVGMDLRFQLLGSEDSYYPGYRPYAAYDYYPYGYENFTRLSFQYYDDPYYGSRYYFPPRRNHHDRDHDHDPDRDHDGDHKDDNPGAPAAFPFKPISPVRSQPQVTRARGDGDSSGQNNQNNENNQPRENRGPRHGRQSTNPPAAQPAVQATVEPVRQPEQRTNPRSGFATRSEVYRNQPARTERTESTRSESPARSSDSPPPSYTPPASRTESSQNDNSERPSRESGRSTFKPSGRSD